METGKKSIKNEVRAKNQSQSQNQIPEHLKKYIVDQNYEQYSPEDQAVWRYIMRRLTDYLAQHAHPCYMEGLERSGISTEYIPRIDEMDRCLADFGWGALPVSGFIPPAAFMEFQSLGILPIASDMRSLDHLLYTPAPDIVHEAAGHAPMLIDPAYARYLRKYAEIASKAIISREDLVLYEAIRILSDMKEDPESTVSEIAEATQALLQATKAVSYTSEASYLSRMNWWTAEYGLIGNTEEARIFGAGLLSSVGESQNYLHPKVKKIPFTIHCLDYSYDITEPQPQLFVTPDFKSLESVLHELSKRMAYKQGGILGLEKALKAQTVNTIELNSGLQISGVLDTYLSKEVACLHEPTFVRLRGPAQLCIKGSQIQGHGTHYHFQGFSSPLGLLRNEAKCLSIMDSQDLLRLGLVIGYRAHLEFASGIELIGTVTKITRGKGKIILISFESCTVRQNENILFQPDWGIFDLAVGHTITSIFGGPADRVHYNHLDDFVAKRVRPRKIPSQKLKEFELYQFIRQFRSRADSTSDPHTQLEKLIDSYFTNFSSNWLAGVELLELSVALNSKKNCQHLEEKLMESKNQKPEVQQCITEGIRLAHQVPCLLGKNGS